MLYAISGYLAEAWTLLHTLFFYLTSDAPVRQFM